jgi:hypothetical protein
VTRKRLVFQDEDFNCMHITAVHDGPGYGVHCVFCQMAFESYEAWEEFRKQQVDKREHDLMVMFDA